MPVVCFLVGVLQHPPHIYLGRFRPLTSFSFFFSSVCGQFDLDNTEREVGGHQTVQGGAVDPVHFTNAPKRTWKLPWVRTTATHSPIPTFSVILLSVIPPRLSPLDGLSTTLALVSLLYRQHEIFQGRVTSTYRGRGPQHREECRVARGRAVRS